NLLDGRAGLSVSDRHALNSCREATYSIAPPMASAANSAFYLTRPEPAAHESTNPKSALASGLGRAKSRVGNRESDFGVGPVRASLLPAHVVSTEYSVPSTAPSANRHNHDARTANAKPSRLPTPDSQFPPIWLRPRNCP